MPIRKTCLHCEKEFSVVPRREDEVKFCSRACKTAAGRRTLKCDCCGVQFERKASEVLGDKTYCSASCYNKSKKGTAKAGSGRPKYWKACEVCAKDFRVTLTRKGTARFCSRACQGESDAFRVECSDRQLGAKSWRWNGGEYSSSQGYVYVRDADGATGRRMLAHRKVILEAMLKHEPSHPFLILVGDEVRLNPDIEVHHIDRNRANNELSNLLAVTKEAHAQIHHRNTKPRPWECWPSNPNSW